jgi:hypothetical protein
MSYHILSALTRLLDHSGAAPSPSHLPEMDDVDLDLKPTAAASPLVSDPCSIPSSRQVSVAASPNTERSQALSPRSPLDAEGTEPSDLLSAVMIGRLLLATRLELVS